jgi:hypothetical protein
VSTRIPERKTNVFFLMPFLPLDKRYGLVHMTCTGWAWNGAITITKAEGDTHLVLADSHGAGAKEGQRNEREKTHKRDLFSWVGRLLISDLHFCF